MRPWLPLAPAALAIVTVAPAQPFGNTHQMLPPVQSWAKAVAVGDLDGDGDLDAYLGGYLERLYLNGGTGLFTDVSATNLPAVGDFTNAVALGDVDADGDLDAFTGNWLFQAQTRLYLNGGTGVFTDATATNLPPIGYNETYEVALGDVDGDGDLDAYLGTLAQDRLFLNFGGVFVDATATNLPAASDFTNAVALGDVDGDGDLDAYVGNTGFAVGGQNRLLAGDGTGAFTDVTGASLPLLMTNTWGVSLEDVDGDGDLDAFAAVDGQDRLQANNGTGVFTDVTATNLPAVTDSTTGVALGDVDGDGDLDGFAGNVTNYGGLIAQNRLYLNGGSGVFANATATNLPVLPENTYGVALGDVDGDGDLDAIAVSENFAYASMPGFNSSVNPGHRLLLNGGNGAFADVGRTNVPVAPDITSSAALGDVDGDGDLDAFTGITGSSSGGQDRLFVNGGTGDFSDVTGTNLPALIGRTGAVALGDVDGDGDLDALLGKTTYDPFAGEHIQTRLFVNGGPGAFTDATGTNLPYLSEMEPTTAVALGDVDGDGDLDAFLAKGRPEYPTWVNPYPGSQNRLFLNNGAGAFANATTNLPAALGQSRAVGLGDVDGDGDLDALVGDWAIGGSWGLANPGGQARLYRNGGTGVFVDVTATSLPAAVEFTTALALGDVDGDGDLDAYLANAGGCGFPGPCTGDPDRLYLNDGTGVFADVSATNLPAVPDLTLAVALGDMDEDGDLDAFLGGPITSSNPPNRLYRNLGAGAFVDVTATDLLPPFAQTNVIALGDVDGDGDLDAFAGVFGQDRTFVNLRRQLSWREIPRAGKPLPLDLRGPASGAWLLAASVGTANIPLPPLGALRLDPATLFIVAGGPLDPQGVASLTVQVPANPALVGASLYWQAVVGPPLRLTNLEVTTVTSL